MEMLDNVLEMEKFVLSAMQIREGECVPAVMATLTADDFYRPTHRLVYRTSVKLYAEGVAPSILSLINELTKTGEIGNVDVEFLYMLTEYANTTAYVPTYCKEIKEAANMRRIQLAAEKLAQDAKKGIKPVADILDEFNATSAALANPAEQFKVATLNDCLDPANSIFLNELKKMADVKRISTGFKNFDEAQIILPGLYLIGAEPAIGKTDFVWQILEQMAHDCRCIYCSYEMSRNTMLRRIIARQIFKEHPFTPITASNLHENVKYREHLESLASAMETLYNQNLDLRALELYGQNVDSLIRLLKPLCDTDRQPVIAIDYLQVLAAATNPDNPKVAVDECLRKLKSFQNDTGALLFIVSSFNRANYRYPVTFASFKESGACEYFADVMLGLQFYAVNKITDKTKPIEVDTIVSDAIRAQPRKIQLKCVKNRNGNSYDLYFKYYSAHSYFEPCDKADFCDDDNIPAHIADSSSIPPVDDSYNFEETEDDEDCGR